MDLSPDFRDLLAAFANCGVRYLLVGGYAVAFHGHPRATKDIDLLIDLERDNRERLASALDLFGAAPSVVSNARTLTSDDVVYFGQSPLRVDLLGSATAIVFDEVYERAVRTDFDGVDVRVIDIPDLLANKRASGRPRDLEDCDALDRIVARAARRPTKTKE